MAEQTQQIPPNRRMRRMQIKESGVLGAISKLSYFHPVKKQIRQQNLENGRKIHQMHVDKHEAAMATFYEERLQAAKSAWFGQGYVKEEIELLEEACALTTIKDKESYRADKKKAKALRKQAAEMRATRTK